MGFDLGGRRAVMAPRALLAGTVAASATRKARRRRTSILRAVSRWIPLLLLVGCSSLTLPETPAEPAFESTKTKSLGGLTVTIAVLGPEECRKVFGLPLLDKGIQPVWVRIENRDDVPYIFQPTSIDVDYFAALEVAYRFYSRFDGDRNRRLDDFFERMAIGRSVEPQHELSGFVFTNVDLGGKHVYAKLVAPGRVREFSFYLHVPGGLLADHERVHFDALFADEAIREIGLAELRRELEALPCCTTNREGTRPGDPLNLVIVGTLEELKAVFTRQRWDETELIYSGSLRKTVGSFLLGTRYRYSPVSSLYVFGRSQDFAMQKIRDNVNARNHLRLWLTPLRFEGKPVWIGQISRDIGVRFTTKTWNLTTHKIAADVDETRNRLVEDLMMAGRMEQLGFVKGVGAAPRNAGRPNLTGDLYFTDGLRAVMVFSGDPVPVLEIRLFDWEWPPKRKETRPLEPEAGPSTQEVVQH